MNRRQTGQKGERAVKRLKKEWKAGQGKDEIGGNTPRGSCLGVCACALQGQAKGPQPGEKDKKGYSIQKKPIEGSRGWDVCVSYTFTKDL